MSRTALLSVGVLLATLACIAVGVVLDRTLRREAALQGRQGPRVVSPAAASVGRESATSPPDIEATEPRP